MLAIILLNTLTLQIPTTKTKKKREKSSFGMNGTRIEKN